MNTAEEQRLASALLIDTHCHLDATAWVLAPSALSLPPAVALARKGVHLCVLPSVHSANARALPALAWRNGYAYALGLHPCYVAPNTAQAELRACTALLHQYADDPALVAIGEIGLDYFISAATTAQRALQEDVLAQQLLFAQQRQLPVILHSRKALEALRIALRRHDFGGIVHAFNGSLQQAYALLDRGYKLGFGGAALYPRARHLQDLLQRLPDSAIVLETDAPDMPPPWLYATQAQRTAGQPIRANDPSELPRIAAALANMRSVPYAYFLQHCAANSLAALPKLAPLLARAACPPSP